MTRLAADARRAGLPHAAQLGDVLVRFPYHPGRARLLPLVLDSGAPTRSAFEDLFVVFCRRWQLPEPQINVVVNGREVDAYFAAEQVIVELDGWEFHRDEHAFEDHRLRDTNALAEGMVTNRISWKRFSGAPARGTSAAPDPRPTRCAGQPRVSAGAAFWASDLTPWVHGDAGRV